MKIRSLVGLLATVGITTPAFANNFNYNYIEFRTAMDPQISGVEFSTLMTENTHLIARADSRFEKDYDLAAGIGFNGPVNQFIDVFGELLAHHIKYPEIDGGHTETQAEVNIGLRVWLADQLEFTTRGGKNGDRSVFNAGFRFHSTQQLSLSAETRNSGLYGPQIALSVRFQY
ncbi:hypothetical protein DZ860_01980 [Vibrio sinensis]|uniref:Acyloxyacyl hydrolase n=1 Tax=Vibrio sinensis TaxID=2302434 RepID=A0A3A6RFI7_9VIBR|nr:hypothetical protein [Vibrio sinensis]RJX75471.1 hypothetical protein DZ860_01980 [Vibrio sinensis]